MSQTLPFNNQTKKRRNEVILKKNYSYWQIVGCISGGCHLAFKAKVLLIQRWRQKLAKYISHIGFNFEWYPNPFDKRTYDLLIYTMLSLQVINRIHLCGFSKRKRGYFARRNNNKIKLIPLIYRKTLKSKQHHKHAQVSLRGCPQEYKLHNVISYVDIIGFFPWSLEVIYTNTCRKVPMCYFSIKIVFVFQNNTLLSFLLTLLGNILLHDNLVPRKALHSTKDLKMVRFWKQAPRHKKAVALFYNLLFIFSFYILLFSYFFPS